MLERDERPILYFAVYVNVGTKSPQRAKEELARVNALLHYESEKQPYRERFFIFPIKNEDSRIELLYPTPFLSEDQAEELYQKYYQKYQDIIQNIKNL